MATTKAKKWTFMVYLAGDNNLDTAGVTDLKEMKKVGTTGDVNVVAQFDNGADHHSRRYLLRKATTLARDEVQDLGRSDTGDPAVLQGFVTWAITKYPAERYALVVWNHGNGWDDEDVYRRATKELGMTLTRRDVTVSRGGRKHARIDHARRIGHSPLRRSLFNTTIDKALALRGIAYDDDAKDFLDNQEMKRVLQNIRKTLGRPLDLLGMDACLMSMAEVLYQVRDTAAVSVASEQTEPGDGWPYDTILSVLVAKPAMDAKELGVAVVQKYAASYGTGDDVTQAACDLTKCETLRAAADELSRVLNRHLPTDAVRYAVMQARHDVQSYERSDYIDVYDFCALLAGNTEEPEIKTACQQAMGAVRECVIETACKGAGVRNSHGLSIYFPQKKISPLYAKLDFVSNSTWAEFLDGYLRRSNRRAAGFRATSGTR